MHTDVLELQLPGVQVDAAAKAHIIPAASGTIVELRAMNIVTVGNAHSSAQHSYITQSNITLHRMV